MMRATLVVAGSLVLAGSAATQERTTMQVLLGQGYQVSGSILTQEGAGLFLQNKDKLVFCVVAESPGSDAVNTRYCKPVR